jgi:hypothetical protein
MAWTTKPPFGIPLDFNNSINNNLVGCWMLNEGQGNIANDLSTNNFSGTIYSTADGWITGKNGKPALSFGPTVASYIDLGLSSVLSLTDQFTISTSVLKGPGGTGGTIIGLGTNVSCYGGFHLEIQYWNGLLAFIIHDSVGSVVYTLNSTTVLDSTIWKDVVVTVNGSNIKIYIDGSLNAGGTSPAPIQVVGTTQSHVIGIYCTRGGGKGFLTASIDELRVWGRILTDTEISTMHTDPYSMFLESCPPLNVTLSIS